MKSIKSKILTVVIAGLLVITAVVSVVAVTATHEIMHTDADRILNNMAQKEAAYINDILGDMSKSATIMESYALSKIETVEQLENMEFRENFLNETKNVFTEIAINTEGTDGFFIRLNPQFTDSTTGFYSRISENKAVQNMPLTDLSKYMENDMQSVSWYYTAVQAKEPVWVSPYYFAPSDTMMISYTIPLYVQSELLGVIGMDVDFEYFLGRLNQVDVYEDGYAVLLAKDGKTRYNNTDKEYSSGDHHTKATASLRNGMYLELWANYQDIQRSILPMLSNIVIAFLGVLTCAIVYTVFVTNKIVRPLKQLTVTAAKLSTDEKLAPEFFDVKSKDEVGTLAKVMGSTYAKIQEYTTYINALAYRDSLTGAKNSTAYTEATANLNQEINCGNPQQFGVLVIDINNLKETNDRYGHNVGDELIIHIAKILMDTFDANAVFRIGGDEFSVILTGKDYENPRTTLERVDEAFAQAYITVGEDRIPVFAARGLSVFDPTTDKEFKDVFKKADQAMYVHKKLSKSKLF